VLQPVHRQAGALVGYWAASCPLMPVKNASHGLQKLTFMANVQAMTGNIRLPDELGREL
jgi:hypothetical protein